MKPKKGMKLEDIVVLWRNSSSYQRLRPNSKAAYETALKTLGSFLKKEAASVTRPMIFDLRDSLYDKPGTCRMALAVLSVVMSYGYDRGIVPYNHTHDLRNMPGRRPHHQWSMDEINKVMAVASNPVRMVLLMALYTGQRRSDLAKMTWECYDGRYIHIIQIKTSKPLSIPVHPNLKAELDKLKKSPYSPYILTSLSGEGWGLSHMSLMVKKAAQAAGLGKEFTLHGIRKTTASCLAEFGCTPSQIAAITGQSLKEVMHYTKQVDQRKLAEQAIDLWNS